MYGDIISDLHKDARGYRPSQYFWEGWKELSDEGQKEIFDMLAEELEIREQDEREMEQRAIKTFEARIADVIKLGAGDRQTALRWITSQEKFYHSQSVEHFVWEQGILFTDYGKKLLNELLEIVEYEEMEWV
jgi:urocanate hydratase